MKIRATREEAVRAVCTYQDYSKDDVDSMQDTLTEAFAARAQTDMARGEWQVIVLDKRCFPNEEAAVAYAERCGFAATVCRAVSSFTPIQDAARKDL